MTGVVADLPPEQREAVCRRNAARDYLARSFPEAIAAFDQPKRPLQVNISRDILRAVSDDPGAPARDDVLLAIRDYVSGPSYLLACTEGAPRVTLTGGTKGVVTETQAAYAIKRMRRLNQKMRSSKRQSERMSSLIFKMTERLKAYKAARHLDEQRAQPV